MATERLTEASVCSLGGPGELHQLIPAAAIAEDTLGGSPQSGRVSLMFSTSEFYNLKD